MTRPKVYAIKIDSKNSVFTKKLVFVDFSIRKNKPIKHVKRIYFGCHWSPDLYKLLNVAVDPEQTTRIPLYAKNVLPWSNTPNKNEWLLTLHGCNHILQLQLRKWNNKHDNNYSSSEVLAR